MKPQHLLSLATLALAALFAANSAAAQVTPFSSDFKGKRQWNWDSRRELGNGNKAHIDGKGIFTISPDGYAAGDGVFIERDATNPAAQDEQGSFTVAFRINPWELKTIDGNVMEMLNIKTATGNKGSFSGGSILMVKLARDSNSSNDSAYIYSQGASVYGTIDPLMQEIEYDAADRDGFIDIQIDIDVTGYGSTWSIDWTQNTLYAGQLLTDSGNYTQTSWPSNGLKDIIAYQLGLLATATETPAGTLTFDDFHVFNESERGAYVDIPEPRTYAIFFGCAAGLIAICRRRRT